MMFDNRLDSNITDDYIARTYRARSRVPKATAAVSGGTQLIS